MDIPNMRALVVAELKRREGDLTKVASESGIAYDTLLRIKNEEGDTYYSKVQKLADYLFQKSGVAKAA